MTPLPRGQEIVPLTAERFDLMVESGCAPCCHVCHRPLAVGDLFGMIILSGSHPTLRGARLTATACAACVRAGGTADAEVELGRREEQRLRNRGRQDGCLFTLDGEILP